MLIVSIVFHGVILSNWAKHVVGTTLGLDTFPMERSFDGQWIALPRGCHLLGLVCLAHHPPNKAERCQTRTMQKMVLLQVGEQHCWIMSLQYLVFLHTNAWEHINKAVSCLWFGAPCFSHLAMCLWVKIRQFPFSFMTFHDCLLMFMCDAICDP